MKRIKLILYFQSFIFLFLYPYYDYPDSSVYLRGFSGYGDYYFFILRKIGEIFDIDNNFNLLRNINYGGRLSNTLMYDYAKIINFDLLFYRTFNVFLIILSLFVMKKLGKKYYYMTISYFVWPTINNSLLNLSPDMTTYFFSPLFIYLLIKDKYIINICAIMFVFKFIDSNIITNLFFLVVFKLITNYRVIYKYKKTLFLLMVIISLFLKKNLPLFISYSTKIDSLVKKDYQNNSYFTKVISTFLSFSSPISHGNLIGLPLIYIYILIISVYIFIKYRKKIIKDNLVLSLLMTNLIVLVMFILIFPDYSNIKYYTYTFIVYDLFLLRGIGKKKFILIKSCIFILYLMSYLKILTVFMSDLLS